MSDAVPMLLSFEEIMKLFPLQCIQQPADFAIKNNRGGEPTGVAIEETRWGEFQESVGILLGEGSILRASRFGQTVSLRLCGHPSQRDWHARNI